MPLFQFNGYLKWTEKENERGKERDIEEMKNKKGEEKREDREVSNERPTRVVVDKHNFAFVQKNGQNVHDTLRAQLLRRER